MRNIVFSVERVKGGNASNVQSAQAAFPVNNVNAQTAFVSSSAGVRRVRRFTNTFDLKPNRLPSVTRGKYLRFAVATFAPTWMRRVPNPWEIPAGVDADCPAGSAVSHQKTKRATRTGGS